MPEPNFELRSLEVREILGRTPPWILRWGIAVILIILLGLVILSTIMAYPDVTQGQIKISTLNPPARIYTKVPATVDDIYVNNNERVAKGDIMISFKEGVESIKAPISGLVNFMRPVLNNQQIMADELLFSIIRKKELFVGACEFSISKGGKVKEGQEVFIRLTDYPYAEFGEVLGQVEYVAAAKQTANYQVSVSLMNGLVTNSGHKINFNPGLSGQAIVIQKDRTLFDRIFESMTF